MSYTILNASNISSYLLSLPTIKEYFNDTNLEVEEIGDGNLNFVFLVSSLNDSSKKLIVKQAVPYLRCVGESYPLSRDRMLYEIRSLQEFAKISNNIPRIYHSDEEMSLIVMEYLANHLIMRYGMIDGTIYPNFSKHIGDYLAHTLFKTSSLYLSSAKKRELSAKFIGNSELCKLTEDFVFTAPFMEDETNADIPQIADEHLRLSQDRELKVNILKLKYKFMTQTDALLHGDLHTGSIMLNQDETFIIDSEFAFMGPMGFDVGALVANLVMSWVSHRVQNNHKYAEWVEQTIEQVWKDFSSEFRKLWNKTKESGLITKGFADTETLRTYIDEYINELLKETIGFAGCKILRRQFGIAGVEDIRGIKDNDTREEANRLAIKIGERFVKGHMSVESIKDILKLFR